MKNNEERIIIINGKEIDLRKLSNEELLQVAKLTANKIRKTKKDLEGEIKKIKDEGREF